MPLKRDAHRVSGGIRRNDLAEERRIQATQRLYIRMLLLRDRSKEAQELASRSITVNCVAPGFIATPMTDKLNDKQREAILSRVPAARIGTGADVAAAAVYLASDEAQRYFADGNNEWPVVQNVKTQNPALKGLGGASFKADPLPVSVMGMNQVKVQQMLDRVGLR